MAATTSSRVPPQFQLSSNVSLRIQRTANGIQVEVNSDRESWCIGELSFPEAIKEFQISQSKLSVRVLITTARSRFAARFFPAEDLAAVQVVERTRGPVSKFDWKFAGSKVISHKQLAAIEWERPTLKLGAFTQYGQLFDYRDWVFAQNSDMCVGMVSLAVGKWSHPNQAFIQGTRTADGLTLDMRWRDASPKSGCARQHRSVRRSYMLIQTASRDVLTPKVMGIDYFEHPEGHAAWQASLVSRFGVNRPQRLDSLKKMNARVGWHRPKQFIYGDPAQLDRGFQRVAEHPELSPDEPFWRKDFATALQRVLELFKKFDDALLESAFLSPLGNAVAIRGLAPMAAQFHMLDYLGHIDDALRRTVIDHLTALAEMCARRDFYPFDYAMTEPEFPYGERSFYRGMLNQNFHTDGYVLVGMAGCVLPDHPRAAHWRRYAVQQFESQMASYVWPGGAWEESHTYANHVKITLMPFILAMRHAPEKLDLMQNKNFRSTCRFFADLITTKDASINNLRGVPPVGDHGYLHGNHYTVFGWLATATETAGDPDHELYRWAYQETGFPHHDAKNNSRIFDPLILPASRKPALTPQLPGVQNLTGYGASCRSGKIGTDEETLLVVRSGLSWGHYHPDQGSFWWWAHGRLLVGDANLADGELKFKHYGHSLLSYPGRDAFQFLDRPNHHVDQCTPLPGGGVLIQSQNPIVAWGDRPMDEVKIPLAQQPHNVRRYEYDGKDRIVITDNPTRSPDGRVLWCLHVVSTKARHDGQRIIFDLDSTSAKLVVTLDVDAAVELKQYEATLGLFCTYAERPLKHTIEYMPESS